MKAEGENPNPFYYHDAVEKPLIASGVDIQPAVIKKFTEYDMQTEPGKTYILYAKN
jgi:hypothetical protein